MSQASCGSSGYALPMVLVVIAVFLIYAGESAARVTREVRVIQAGQNGEVAFYAAEAGFNRVRSRMIKNASESKILDLNGRVDTLSIDNSTRGGTYLLSVVKNPDGSYYVESIGTFGAEPFAARRIVRGTLKDSGPALGRPGDRVVSATYSP